MNGVLDETATREPWEQLRQLVEAGEPGRLNDYIDRLPPREAVRAILRLDPGVRDAVLTTLTPADAADLVEELPDEHAADIIERLPVEEAASILSEMRSDDQADVIAELDQDEAEAILAEMAPEEARSARRLAAYDAEVAGGLMQTEFLAFQRDNRVRDVIEALSERADQYREYEIQYVYVVSRFRRLQGVLPLNRLIFAPRMSELEPLMVPSLSVPDQAPLEELALFFDRHPFLGVPVVDENRRLVGVVTRHAVETAMSERAESDLRKTQGIVHGDEIRSMPLLLRSRRRLSWLSINIVLNIMAASVIALYEDTLSAVIALAVFLPIVSDMSGCSGNQAVAVSLRELALGLVRPAEIVRVWLKEVSVGLINGSVLGTLLGIAAWLWKGNVYLGLVIGLALALNTVVAVSIGAVVPLVLKRFGVDPAVASSPILTTATDMIGFFLVLSIANMMLAYLI